MVLPEYSVPYDFEFFRLSETHRRAKGMCALSLLLRQRESRTANIPCSLYFMLTILVCLPALHCCACACACIMYAVVIFPSVCMRVSFWLLLPFVILFLYAFCLTRLLCLSRSLLFFIWGCSSVLESICTLATCVFLHAPHTAYIGHYGTSLRCVRFISVLRAVASSLAITANNTHTYSPCIPESEHKCTKVLVQNCVCLCVESVWGCFCMATATAIAHRSPKQFLTLNCCCCCCYLLEHRRRPCCLFFFLHSALRSQTHNLFQHTPETQSVSIFWLRPPFLAHLQRLSCSLSLALPPFTSIISLFRCLVSHLQLVLSLSLCVVHAPNRICSSSVFSCTQRILVFIFA